MSIELIKENYNFTAWDEKELSKLAPIMDSHAEEFVDRFYDKISKFKNSSKYLKNDDIIQKHRDVISGWFSKLFHGPYDDDYLHYLEKIGYTHVKIELPSHYVNVSVSFVRKFCTDIIMKEVPACEERGDMIHALGKILDLNLDVLTSSYIKEEKNIYFISKKAEGKLINFAKRFSYGLNLILVMGLVILGLTVLGLSASTLAATCSGKKQGGVSKNIASTLLSITFL